jgi:UDP-N-acetylglucosamine transferase subunit ALG13
MIFVTVGTHEQPFDRLVRAIDLLKGKKIIEEDVFIQTGYSLYKPRFCEHAEFLRFPEMRERIKRARIVVTHGGANIMLILQEGKVPIVVPRQKGLREHVDDNQVHFCKKLEEKSKIIAVYTIEEIEDKIKNYNFLVGELKPEESGISHEQRVFSFVQALDVVCSQLIKNRKGTSNP